MRRTAKGQFIDFDLIKAKQQIAEKPKPKEVSVRQEIIDRRLRKKTSAMNPSVINKQEKEPAPTQANEVNVENETVPEDVSEVDSSPSEEVKPKRRQKTKAKTSNGDENESNTTAE